MIGKILADRWGWTEKLGGTQNATVNVITKVNGRELQALKEDIQDCNTTVDVDVAIKEHGLSDIEGLPQHIKELYEKGEIDKLKSSDINNLIQTQNYTNIAKQANGILGVKQAIDRYNEGIKEGTLNTDQFVSAISSSNANLGEYLTGLNGAKAGLGSYAGFLVTATAKTIALEAVTTALNAAISFGISFLISKAVTAIDDLIHREEKLAESAEESKSNIDELCDQLSELKSKASDVVDEYAKLSQGIDQVTGKNVSLSSDDYERFLELSNQLTESLPNATYTIDENGNKLLNLSGNVNQVTASLQDLIKAEQELAHNEIGENLQSIFKSDYKELKENVNDLNELGKESYINSETFSVDLKTLMNQLINGESIKLSAENQNDIDVQNTINDILQDYGLSAMENIGNQFYLSDADLKYIDKELGDTLGKDADNAVDLFFSHLSEETQEKVAAKKEEINEENQKLSQELISWVTSDPNDYASIIQKYGSEYGTLIQNAILGVNWGDLIDKNEWDRNNFADEAKNYITENIISPLESMDNSNVRTALEQLFNNFNSLTGNEIEKYYQTLINEFGENSEYASLFQDSLNQMSTYINQIQGFSSVNLSQLKTVKYSELESIASLSVPDGTILSWAELQKQLISTSTDFSELQNIISRKASLLYTDSQSGFKYPIEYLYGTDRSEEEIQKVDDQLNNAYSIYASARERIVELAKSDEYSASSIFNVIDSEGNNTFTDSVDTIVTKMNSLREAKQKLESGNMSDSDLYELYKTFPELIDETDNLSNAINNMMESADDDALKDINDQLDDLYFALDHVETKADQADIQSKIYDLENLRDIIQSVADSTGESTDAFTAWKNAQNTTDAGANYDTLYSALEQFKSDVKDGLIGTDQTQAFAQLFLGNDEDIKENIDKAVKNAKRYLTEGGQGLNNFLDDLLANNLASKNKSGGYDITGNIEDIGNALGISAEAVEIFLNKYKDYGQEINIYKNAADASSQYAEALEEIAILQAKVDSGTATNTEAKQLEELTSTAQKAKKAMKELKAEEAKENKSNQEGGQNYNNAKKYAESLYEQYTDPSTYKGLTSDQKKSLKEKLANSYQEVIDEFNLDQDSENGQLYSVSIKDRKSIENHSNENAQLQAEQAQTADENAKKETQIHQTYLNNLESYLEKRDTAFRENNQELAKYYQEQYDNEVTAYSKGLQEYQNYLNQREQLTSDYSSKQKDAQETSSAAAEGMSAQEIVDAYENKTAIISTEQYETAKKQLLEENAQAEELSISLEDASGSAKLIADYAQDIKFSQGVKDSSTMQNSIHSMVEDLNSINGKTFNVNIASTTDTSQSSKKTPAGMPSGIPNATGNVLSLNGNKAFAKGLNNGDSLIGELGSELLVRDGKWQLMGENGAEKFNYKKGDIIFNASQTEELLKSGSITGRGTAFATGNAFAGTNSSVGKLNSSSSSSSSNTKSSSKNSSSSSTSSTEQSIDWLERKVTSLTGKLDLLKAKIENVFTVKKKNSIIDQEITKTNKLIKTYQKQAKVYKNQATASAKSTKTVTGEKKSTLSKSLQKKIQNGKITGTKKELIQTYGEKTANAIQEYQDYWDKYQEALTNVQSAKTSRRELKIEKKQNYVDKYDALSDKYDAQMENATTAKDKNALEEKKLASTKKSYDYQIKIAKLEKDSVKVATLKAEKETAIRESKNQQLQNLSDEQSDKYTLNQQLESNANTAAEKNKYEAASLNNLKSQYAYEIQIAHNNGDTTEEKRLQAELEEKVIESQKQQIENIKEEYDLTIGILDARSSTISSQISALQANGYEVSADLYKEQQDIALENYSTTLDKIKDVSDNMQGLDPDSQDYKNYLEELESYKQEAYGYWETWADIQDTINSINLSKIEHIGTLLEYQADQLEYIQNILGHSDFTLSDKEIGGLTMEGLASAAITFEQMQNNNDQIANKWEQIAEIQRQIESSEYVGTQEEAEETINDLVEAINELENSNYDLGDSIKSLVEDSLSSLSDALDESITKYKDALQAEKDLYDFRKQVADQLKSIASLEKQLAALQGDQSEEARAKIQQLKISLEEENESLKETEYEQYIQDQEDLLDKVSEDFQDFIATVSDASVSEICEAVGRAVTDNKDEISQAITSAFDESTAISSVATSITSLSEIMNNLDFSTNITLNTNSSGAITGMSVNGTEIQTTGTGISDVSSNIESASAVSSSLFEKSGNTANNTESTNALLLFKGGNTSSESKETKTRTATQKKIDEYIPGKLKSNDKLGYTLSTIAARTKNDPATKYLMQKYNNKSLSYTNEANLANSLAGTSKYIPADFNPNKTKAKTLKKNGNALLTKLKNAGFSKGGIVSKLNKVALENGDDGWVTLQRGESVLTPLQTEQFQKLTENLVPLNSVVDTLTTLPDYPVPSRTVDSSMNIGNVTVEAHLDGSRVTDVDSFIQTLHEPKVLKEISNGVSSQLETIMSNRLGNF